MIVSISADARPHARSHANAHSHARSHADARSHACLRAEAHLCARAYSASVALVYNKGTAVAANTPFVVLEIGTTTTFSSSLATSLVLHVQSSVGPCAIIYLSVSVSVSVAVSVAVCKWLYGGGWLR